MEKDFSDFLNTLTENDFVEISKAASNSFTENGKVNTSDIAMFAISTSQISTLELLRRYHEWLQK